MALGQSGCNAPCHDNNECFDPVCHRCSTDNSGRLGICVPGYNCGHNCNKNSDCSSVTDCTVCVNNTCTVDPEGCGYFCQNDLQCDSIKCNRCIRGLCSPGGRCGDNCDADKDCSQITSCMWCLPNRVGVKKCTVQCLAPCQSNDQCSVQCPYCVQYGPDPDKVCYTTNTTFKEKK